MKWSKAKTSVVNSSKKRPGYLPQKRDFPVLPINCHANRTPRLVRALKSLVGQPLKAYAHSAEFHFKAGWYSSEFVFGGPKHQIYRLGASPLRSWFSIVCFGPWQLLWRGRTAIPPTKQWKRTVSPLAQRFKGRASLSKRRFRVQSIGMTKDFGLLIRLSGGWTLELQGLNKSYEYVWEIRLPDEDGLRGHLFVIDDEWTWNTVSWEQDCRPATEHKFTHISQPPKPRVRFIGDMKPGP